MSPLPRGIRAALLDVEGTTTALSFVTHVLFPYARAHLRSHLATGEGPQLLEQLRDAHRASVERGERPPPWQDTPQALQVASAAAFAEWLMDRDSKSTPLKALQGRIWERGYREGTLVGHVFPDVAAALARWQLDHVIASIYSSGSVLAQQMLFRYSSAGDLTPLLHAYFDTAVGTKTDPASYASIAGRLELPADAVLFVSDVPPELDAARQAGMAVCLMVRPGNAPVRGHRYPQAYSFDEL